MQHAREQASTRTRNNAAIYNGARWRRLRAHVLAIEPACRACGAQATEVDHVVPIEAGGGPFDLHNVQPLCGHCHKVKTAHETRFADRRPTDWR